MADKIKAIKIKQKNGTYSEEVPISVNVQNVQWDENNHTLLDALGSVDISSSGKGNLQHQIDELDGDKISTNQFNSRLNDFLKDQISADTTDWLDDNVNPVGSAVIVDKTLTIEGAAADAKAVKTELDKKANASNTYTKAEVNAAIDAKQIEVDDTLSLTGTAADAKIVGDELTAAKAGFNHIDDALGINYSDVSLWESGGINLPDGQEWETNTRIRTEYIPRTSDRIKPASGYQIGIYVYNSSNTYLGMYNGTDYSKSEPYWYSSAAFIAEIPASYKLRLLAKKDSDENISPSDATNILFGGSYTDKSLTMPDKAADAKITGDELRQSDTYQKLLCDDVPDTVQTYTFLAGSVSQVTHTKNGTAVRTDAFTYGESTITEVRTLSTGESLTIVTNLTTLETTVTYSSVA